MKLLIKISLRNLFRQKQRSILLGTGIAFGMTILIMANAFSHGLSDILLNRIIKTMTGHFLVMSREKPAEKTRGLIRDKERFKKLILDTVQGDVQVTEGISTQSMGGRGMTRALGNGASSMIVVVGVTKESFMERENVILSGRAADIFENTGLENPVVLYDTMAENLNVKLNDTIRVRFNTVYGQVQAAKFTVVSILKSTNPFMSMAAFTSQEILKPLIGLNPQETGALSIVINDLDNPQKVIEQAKRLHRALSPGAAGFLGQISINNQTENVTVLGISPKEEIRREFAAKLQLSAGKADELWGEENNALISNQTAQRLNIGIGDTVSMTYETKFQGISPPRKVLVKGMFKSNDLLSNNLVIVHPQLLYKTFIPVLPKNPAVIDRKNELFRYLLEEWMILEISPDRDSMMKKFEELGDSSWQGRTVDVVTMYAIASEVLEMERVLDIVTLIAVLVLFFIILIGVVNTLRMTIRERTREIGTVRAIGMQRSDVRWSFMLEVVFLAFFASIAGTILSFVLMKAALLIELNPEGMFSIFLVDHHLHFMPTASDIVTNLVVIIGIAALTAIIPANRASKLSVADALRHVE